MGKQKKKMISGDFFNDVFRLFKWGGGRIKERTKKKKGFLYKLKEHMMREM